MRDPNQTWTEQQERLLFAAQAIVNDAVPYASSYDVDKETFETLKAVVKEISDDAEQAIVAALKEGG
jgi:hypothetical protein